MSQDFNSFVGKHSKYYEDSVDQQRFLDFASVTHSPSSLRLESLDSSQVPTIFTIFRLGEFELMEQMGLQLKQILHAEQGYDYLELLKPGIKIRYRTELVSVHKKEGKEGALYFMTFATPIERSLDQVVLAVARSTMVYREKSQ